MTPTLKSCWLSLAGKKAIITGGASGIGLSVAIKLLEQGCAVTIFDRTSEQVDAVVSELKSRGQISGRFVDLFKANLIMLISNEHNVLIQMKRCVDVSSSAQVSSAWQAIGPVSILVNSVCPENRHQKPKSVGNQVIWRDSL